MLRRGSSRRAKPPSVSQVLDLGLAGVRFDEERDNSEDEYADRKRRFATNGHFGAIKCNLNLSDGIKAAYVDGCSWTQEDELDLRRKKFYKETDTVKRSRQNLQRIIQKLEQEDGFERQGCNTKHGNQEVRKASKPLTTKQNRLPRASTNQKIGHILKDAEHNKREEAEQSDDQIRGKCAARKLFLKEKCRWQRKWMIARPSFDLANVKKAQGQAKTPQEERLLRRLAYKPPKESTKPVKRDNTKPSLVEQVGSIKSTFLKDASFHASGVNSDVLKPSRRAVKTGVDLESPYGTKKAAGRFRPSGAKPSAVRSQSLKTKTNITSEAAQATPSRAGKHFFRHKHKPEPASKKGSSIAQLHLESLSINIDDLLEEKNTETRVFTAVLSTEQQSREHHSKVKFAFDRVNFHKRLLARQEKQEQAPLSPEVPDSEGNAPPSMRTPETETSEPQRGRHLNSCLEKNIGSLCEEMLLDMSAPPRFDD